MGNTLGFHLLSMCCCLICKALLEWMEEVHVMGKDVGIATKCALLGHFDSLLDILSATTLCTGSSVAGKIKGCACGVMMPVFLLAFYINTGAENVNSEVRFLKDWNRI